MDLMTILGIIILAVIGIIWLAKNLLKGKKLVEVDYAQGVFATLFMQDPEMLEFAGKDHDAAMAMGQDRLWEETRKFRTAIDTVIENGSIKAGDYTIISSALKITKIAYIMQSIEDDGPIELPQGLVIKTDESPKEDTGSD